MSRKTVPEEAPDIPAGYDETWHPDATIRPPPDDSGNGDDGAPKVALPGRDISGDITALAIPEKRKGSDRLGGSKSDGGSADPLRSIDLEALPVLSLASEDAQSDADIVLRGELGEGGMGVVSLAWQRSLRREVAVKRVRPGVVSRSQLRSLLREGMVTGALEHPNIISVHALGKAGDDEQPALVMKRVKGTSWRELILDDAHPAWDALSAVDRLTFHIEVLIQTCNAVSFAHSHGILHRDIKPDNVMVGEFGEVYLLDWGIALPLAKDARELSSTIVGTPSYMAPEMVRGNAEISARTDVYLLGATLHEVLTKTTRHGSESATQALMAASQSNPAHYAPDIPAELGRLCNRACAREPKERYQSAREFREALQSFLQHRSAIALAESAEQRLEELIAAIDSADHDVLQIHRLFNECRFGFQQALREWPGNARATDGLQRCLEAMIEHTLNERDAGFAERLYSELLNPAPELEARIDALRRSLRSRSERLDALERDFDAGVSYGQRGVFLIFFGLFFVVALSVIMVFYAQQDVSDDVKGPLFLSAALSVVVIVLGYVKRDIFLSNRINRHLGGSVLSFFIFITINRVLGILLEEPIRRVLLRDILLGLMIATLGGLMIDPFFFLFALFFALALSLSMAWVSLSPFLLAGAVACCVGAALVRRYTRKKTSQS